MSRLASIAGIGLIAALGFTPVSADQPTELITIPDNGAAQWGPAPASLPKGMTWVVLAGDPAKPGPFVLRVMMPPGTLIAPHTHKTAENLTVISGDFYHGHGKTVDRTGGTEVHTGGFVYLPANHPHYLWTTNEPTVLQVTGTGPFGVDYINPADDPSKKS